MYKYRNCRIILQSSLQSNCCKYCNKSNIQPNLNVTDNPDKKNENTVFKKNPEILESGEDKPQDKSPQKYDPKSVTKEDMRWRTPWHQKEGQYYNYLRVFSKEESNRSVLKMLQTPFDLSPSSIKKWLAKKQEEVDLITQSYIPERNQILGNELAAAHFIVHRGGAVKFHNHDTWIKADRNNNYTLPRHYQKDKILQAIDCTDMDLYYEGLANLRDLENVEWLSLNGCVHMDDWCMDLITNVFSHSLIYLDLRNCPNITDKGIAAIYKIRNLRILYLDDFLRSTIYEYTCLLLEEINPNLQVTSDRVTFELK